ncbi:MAG: phosphoenolpyruvate-protein phosphotransferase [Gammaproteobacteria bacterium]|nr:phosphoenolpyruvate-protein phosphotransferase [Gammaproteobacteria bacterium]
MILEDTGLQQTLFNALEEEAPIENTQTAEEALINQFEIYSSHLRCLDAECFSNSAEDFEHLKHDLLRILRGQTAHLYCKEASGCTIGQCRLGNDHILVTPRLTASIAVQIGPCPSTKGVVVESGGCNSHATIIARAFNLPVVSQIPHLETTVPLDSIIVVDGDRGELVINPYVRTLAMYKKRQLKQSQNRLYISQPVPGLQVLADIDSPEDLEGVIKAGAEGIGLYRTEIEVLRRGGTLNEDEQFALYKQMISAMGGKPVYIRLLDLGSDKCPSLLKLPREENPALGCRGARLLLARPELLRSQARALARASQHGPIHIIYPMIISLDQFIELRALFQKMIMDLPSGKLYHGVMFEVPSAGLQCEEILEHADFGRIGTNDLTQYLFAVDRQDDYNRQATLFDQPALWSLIETISRAARKKRKPLSLCGELVNDPGYTGRIMSCRVQMVSIRPRQIAAIRAAASAYRRSKKRAGKQTAATVNGGTLPGLIQIN